MMVVRLARAGELAAMVLGSVERYAATRAACPVVVVRGRLRASHQGRSSSACAASEDCERDAYLRLRTERTAQRAPARRATSGRHKTRTCCRTRHGDMVRMTGVRAPPGKLESLWPAGREKEVPASL